MIITSLLVKGYILEVNADFKQRIVIPTDNIEWQQSPMPGVSRKMLDRIGAEVARATSIVRYAPNSTFPSHTHDGGEEFFVLEGVFQDEHGDYPAGTYIRNPPTSKHTPRSELGCLIFVKLWQFDLEDRTVVNCNTKEVESKVVVGGEDIKTLRLHQDVREKVCIEMWPPYSTITLNTFGGAELLVLNGSVEQGCDVLLKHSWLRLPINANGKLTAGNKGAQVWVKTGHLEHIKAPNS